MEPVVFHLGDVIRKVRKRQRKGLERFAKESGVNKATLSKLERTGSRFDSDTLEKVAAALRLSEAELRSAVPVSAGTKVSPERTDEPLQSPAVDIQVASPGLKGTHVTADQTRIFQRQLEALSRDLENALTEAGVIALAIKAEAQRPRGPKSGRRSSRR